MARWITKLSLVGLGAALLVGAAGCVIEEDNWYAACAGDLDCTGFLTCQSVNGTNICTDTCSTDAECGGGGTCYSTTTGGSVCAILDGPPPPPPPPSQLVFYEPGCSASTPCIATATCYTLTNTTGESDSMCSDTCSFDADCGTNGYCIQQYASSSICFQACGTDTDCFAGWHCEQIEDFETKELVPACIPGW